MLGNEIVPAPDVRCNVVPHDQVKLLFGYVHQVFRTKFRPEPDIHDAVFSYLWRSETGMTSYTASAEKLPTSIRKLEKVIGSALSTSDFSRPKFVHTWRHRRGVQDEIVVYPNGWVEYRHVEMLSVSGETMDCAPGGWLIPATTALLEEIASAERGIDSQHFAATTMAESAKQASADVSHMFYLPSKGRLRIGEDAQGLAEFAVPLKRVGMQLRALFEPYRRSGMIHCEGK